VLIPEKRTLIDPTQDKMAIFGQIWPSMGLITILADNNFTSLF